MKFWLNKISFRRLVVKVYEKMVEAMNYIGLSEWTSHALSVLVVSTGIERPSVWMRKVE